MIEVFKFRPDDSHIFYNDLVWTFQHVCIIMLKLTRYEISFLMI